MKTTVVNHNKFFVFGEQVTCNCGGKNFIINDKGLILCLSCFNEYQKVFGLPTPLGVGL